MSAGASRTNSSWTVATRRTPEGTTSANGALHVKRPKTLAGQLDELGVKPADIKAMAISHTHPDHIGNVELFPQVMLYVQKAEYVLPGTSEFQGGEACETLPK